ncbi:hypothetical protein [Micromonospora sp. ATCC 39149]|uniref:hypothetical protein n=1 Tax=Micromonospora sp. (strain ATCC 39149 / NRRL 15099 / SCC 1413) TaxID=219305 RepID=UPI000568CC0C|nr:hypothetical protein [Micromonospora sp. ATCC 39149]
MTTTNHSKPVRLAGAALTAAVENDWRRASDAVERLNRECPGAGLMTALIAWCDTFAAHANGGAAPTFGKVRLKPWAVGTGSTEQEVPARTRWAIDLIQARAEGDEAAFNAVVQQLNDISDGYQRGNYVSALLESIALTIRSLPRGYARMGSR